MPAETPNVTANDDGNTIIGMDVLRILERVFIRLQKNMCAT